MKIIRAMVMLAMLLCAQAALAVQVNTYSGVWYDLAKSGTAVMIDEQGANLFVTWLTYGASGSPTWFVMTGNLNSAGAAYTGPIYSYSGSQYGPNYNPASVTGTTVGTGSFAFTGNNNATFSYTANGISGTLALTRYNYGTPSILGTYTGGNIRTASTCPSRPVGPAGAHTWTVTQNGSGVVIMGAPIVSGASCSHSGAVQQLGGKFLFQGTFSCADASSGTATAEITPTDDTLVFRFTRNITAGADAPCTISGIGGGLRN